MTQYHRAIKGAPTPVGPYSTAVEVGDLLFISGQGGIDPDSGEIAETVEEQTQQTMANLQAILANSGLDFSRVVKTSIFLMSMSDFATVNKIYESFFPSDPPARTTVGVAALPLSKMKIEIDMVAARR